MKFKSSNRNGIIKSYEIKLNDLDKNDSKEDIWAIDNDLILNVKYRIYDDKIILPGNI